ncbi:MAG: PQQ-dependent sugar dehydrogenase, partial [Candidatus Palauibacterales bacterium]|nr:PQQ-dependent sugar dehydrogenase [Candidatus Palauibacterales bacterium]
MAVAALVAWAGCGDDGSPPSGPSDGVSDVSLAVEEVVTGLSRPLHLTSPAGDSRLFVVEKGGVVRVITGDGTLQSEPYLDLTGRVSTGGEQGLLSLVFHPDFATNGRFFVNFTDTS